MSKRVVIIGNGMAGARLQEELHRLDPTGTQVTSVVIGDEPNAAYNRILMSNVVAGRIRAADTMIRAAGWYSERNLQTHTGVRVTSIDRDAQNVRCDDGTVHQYDNLVFATGSRAFIPPIAGATTDTGTPIPGVIAFRNLADCEAIVSALQENTRVVVVGGGLLGLEAARGALLRGAQVTVVHPRAYPMEKQMDAAGGAVLSRVLREIGMDVVLGTRVTAVRDAPGTGREVVLADGSTLGADLVIVTAGIAPNIELAAEAGIATERGILVDDHLRTSDRAVFAIGECAQHRDIVYGLVQPGWEMAETVAQNLLASEPTGYEGTQQILRLKAHDIDLASMGEVDTDPGDLEAEVLTLSDPHRGRYAKVVVRKERLVGAVLLGNPEVVGTITQLFDSGAPVPTDRMRLLLGHLTGGATESASPAQMPGEAIICRCNTVSKKNLTDAWRKGARNPLAMAEATRATTGCGSCESVVEGLCEWLATADA
ncbi:FAD-dependent oxidoreductase [Williamsia soli]|uniref:FAD-dependent oxidoreductase n=1 Tax=Williamsia soli TaxID=364929 RepID=UPI001A9EB901|nr:FAD-dependent oxidoreductase [Williamsia soli]